MQRATPTRNTRGFTLIELAIVLVIIGLIVGGVMVGQDIWNAARRMRVVQELSLFETQTNMFVEKYRYLPGDFPRATTMLGACCNGDGNGRVGEDYAGFYREACVFWQHMKFAGLLQEYALTYVNNAAGSCQPSEVPTSAYSDQASWHMGLAGANFTFPSKVADSNYFVLKKGAMYGRTMSYVTNVNSIISPPNARGIDEKMDDGKPLTGRVIADNNLGTGLASAPYAPQQRYCLFGAGAVETWTYYNNYEGDGGGCMMAFRAKF